MILKIIKRCCFLFLLVLTFTAQAFPAKRIIALSPHSVEMLYAIGAGDKIIATTEYADFPEAAKNIPRIGGYYGIQIEKVLSLNPDLIVVWSDGNKSEDIEHLKKLGFTLFDSNPKTLESVADNLEKLGKLTGHQKQAKVEAENYRRTLQNLKQQNQHKAKISVFYQLWSQPLMTVSGNSWIQKIITVCQGDNVFANASSDYPQLSLENVLVKNPQAILESKQNSVKNPIDWNQWPEITAVKYQHIYTLDADLMHRPSPRALLGIQRLCNALDKARL